MRHDSTRPATEADPQAIDPCWRELMSTVLDGPFSAENRLEALIDHIERGPRSLLHPTERVR